MSIGKYLQPFRRNIVSSSLGATSAIFLVFCGVFDPEFEGNTIALNIAVYQ